jgi:hypothetical protein
MHEILISLFEKEQEMRVCKSNVELNLPKKGGTLFSFMVNFLLLVNDSGREDICVTCGTEDIIQN